MILDGAPWFMVGSAQQRRMHRAFMALKMLLITPSPGSAATLTAG
jgi:hypothetical protein